MMLKQRFITAIILIFLVLLALIFLPPIGFNTVVILVTAMASWEWATMVGIKSFHNKAILLLITCGILWGAYKIPDITLWISMVWWFFVFGKLHVYPRGKEYWSNNIYILSAMSVFVLVPFALALIILRNQPYGLWQIFYVLTLVWAADIGGYFIGRQWGTWKIAPQLSPKKSYQGFVGSLVASFIIASVAAWQLHIANEEYFAWFGFTLLIVIFALMGDLYESMIKRAVGVKDSGTLLPGHGGLLDRIDALTATIPLFTLISLMYGRHFIL